MKKFIALYMAPQSLIAEWAKASAEDKKKGMEEWMAWSDEHEDDLVEFGTPLGKNKRVSSEGVRDESNEVAGYSIIQAESHDQAVEIMKTNPYMKEKGGWIDVTECMEMGGK